MDIETLSGEPEYAVFSFCRIYKKLTALEGRSM
jgi:hypothetical protein